MRALALKIVFITAFAVLLACGGDDNDELAPITLGGDDTTPLNDGTPFDPFEELVDNCDGASPGVVVEAGERATIAGEVVGTSVASDSQGSVFVLELGAEGGDVLFAIAIPERALPNFPAPPRETYDGEQICVSGVVVDYQGIPTIFVTQPGEIREIERSP